MFNIRSMTTLVAAIALCFAAARAQDFDLSWYTVDGGGVMFSKAEPFELSGTMGQPDAGTVSEGPLTLEGGFWPGTGGASPAKGACCLPDDTCKKERTKSVCDGMGGVWHQGKTCSEACPPLKGACCLPDGTCKERTKRVCDVMEGVWHQGETCSEACPPLKGACCLPDGTCKERTKRVCDVMGGVWHQGKSCNEACPGCKGKEEFIITACKVKPRTGKPKKVIVKIRKATPLAKYKATLKTGQTLEKNAAPGGKVVFIFRGGNVPEKCGPNGVTVSTAGKNCISRDFECKCP